MIDRTRFQSLVVAGFTALAVTGCATVGPAAPRTRTVDIRGPLTKAVVTGPVEIHAYADASGGAMFTAPLVTGTDGDCRVGGGDLAPGATALRPDNVIVYRVPEGRIACVANSDKGTFELLWHSVTAGSAVPKTDGSLQAKN